MAKKNPNGTGSRPRKRSDGRYEARYWIDTPEGRKRRSVYAATSKECAEKLANALAQKDEPSAFEPTCITIGGFLAEYQDALRHSLKRRSFENASDVIRLHLLPELGSSTRLTELSREQVQRLYSKKLNAGLSPARVSCIHRVLSAALNHAVKWQLVERNICEEVSKPRVPAPEIRPFSKDEAKRFLAAAAEDRYEALMVLGLTSGARWGELTGLFWSDLDLERRVMHIQRALVRGYGGYSFEEPKTKGSRRSVKLTLKGTQALIRHRERQKEEGLPVDDNSLVFTNTIGKPIHASNFIRRNFKPLLQRANLPDTNWHAATRHTCTCILLLEGVNPKSVAMQMGWSSVAFMLEQYARFMPGWGDNGIMDSALD